LKTGSHREQCLESIEGRRWGTAASLIFPLLQHFSVILLVDSLSREDKFFCTSPHSWKNNWHAISIWLNTFGCLWMWQLWRLSFWLLICLHIIPVNPYFVTCKRSFDKKCWLSWTCC
jgi:hypothetical protein